MLNTRESFMILFILLLIGLVIGSFLNVVALRYNSDGSVFDLKNLGGRSRCSKCGATLRWHDLIPVLSFLMLRGRCRECHDKISFQYPVVELFSGLALISPFYFYKYYFVMLSQVSGESIWWFYALAIVWVLTFLSFILLALIDWRLQIIPDSLNLFLAGLGIFKISTLYLAGKTATPYVSFVNGYAGLFGLGDNIFLNYLAAALFGLIFFGIIIYITRGAGMGMGDLKLATALGLLLGWPDIALVTVLAFIIGSLWGLWLIVRYGVSMKQALPFGPFIVLGALITIFFGEQLLRIYFGIFRI